MVQIHRDAKRAGIEVLEAPVKQNETSVRAAPAVVLTSAAILVAQVTTAAAAGAPQVPVHHSVGHAMVLFVIVWLLASLRIGKRDGIWRFGFELSPIKRIAGAPAATTAGSKEPQIMRSTFVSRAFSALVYCQALLVVRRCRLGRAA